VSGGGTRITARESQLLAAIRELVNLPDPAGYDHRQAYNDELASRAAWLAGYLRDDADFSLRACHAAIMTETIRKRAARPLPYLPEQAAEQPA